jgi:hypothetical protein
LAVPELRQIGGLRFREQYNVGTFENDWSGLDCRDHTPEPLVGDTEAGSVTFFDNDPSAKVIVDPFKVQWMDREATLVLLARCRQNSQSWGMNGCVIRPLGHESPSSENNVALALEDYATPIWVASPLGLVAA